jgi:hypothetical protein
VRGPEALDDRDREVLAFVAAHRMVAADHVMVLLAKDVGTAHGRLGQLEAEGFVRRERLFRRGPDCYRITPAGLSSIRSDLAPPEFDPRYRHDVGVAWVWLAATRGTFGTLDRVVTEREMREADQKWSEPGGLDGDVAGRPAADVGAPPFGVPVTGVDGDRSRHYPDLLLIGRGRVAVELQLALPSPRRLREILVGYGADARVWAVLFLVVDPEIAGRVESAAAQLGISQMVQVQPAKFGTKETP